MGQSLLSINGVGAKLRTAISIRESMSCLVATGPFSKKTAFWLSRATKRGDVIRRAREGTMSFLAARAS